MWRKTSIPLYWLSKIHGLHGTWYPRKAIKLNHSLHLIAYFLHVEIGFSVFFLSFKINSSPPKAAYMHHWIGFPLVQIMACHLFGATSLSKPMLGYCQLDSQEQTSVKFYQNTKLFIHKKAYENIVCEMAAILFRARWVNWCHLEPNFAAAFFVTVSVVCGVNTLENLYLSEYCEFYAHIGPENFLGLFASNMHLPAHN